jgi:hypothetical protein
MLHLREQIEAKMTTNNNINRSLHGKNPPIITGLISVLHPVSLR